MIMPLNPFAREYVPVATKQSSLLTVSEPRPQAQSKTESQPAATPERPQAQPVASSRCPTPAAQALEAEEFQFEDVFEAGPAPSPPSPRSHLSPVSPGGLSMVRTILSTHQMTCTAGIWERMQVLQDGHFALRHKLAGATCMQVSASSSPCSSPAHSAMAPSEMPPNTSGEVAGQPSNLADAKVGPADFNLLRVVGQGAFGKVILCQKSTTSAVLVNGHLKQGTHAAFHPRRYALLTTGVSSSKEGYWSNLRHEDHAQREDSCQRSWRVCEG